MRFHLVLILAATAFAADDTVLTLSIRAQSDFDRVRMAAVPSLPDTIACVQSQAALLPVAPPREQTEIHYRKGYCTLLGATVTKNKADYREAARAFDKAIEASPAIEPAPSGLHLLAGIAHLRAGDTDDPRVKAGLATAIGETACSGRIMAADDCGPLTDAGRLWLGWLALQRRKPSDAAQYFQTLPESGWHSWVAGLQAMAVHRPADAARAFDKAVQVWSHEAKYPQPGILGLLAPAPDLAEAEYQLGAARFLAGDYPAAIRSLGAAVKARPADARAIYMRGRAKEALGQSPLEDYELASRTAFASVQAPSSAEAHFYRGVWLFGRKEYDRAEEQFASSLNFGAGGSLRPDVTAWWRMAAVAAGACDASASNLEHALQSVSDFFPRQEAESLIRTCRSAARLAPNSAPAAR